MMSVSVQFMSNPKKQSDDINTRMCQIQTRNLQRYEAGGIEKIMCVPK